MDLGTENDYLLDVTWGQNMKRGKRKRRKCEGKRKKEKRENTS
jgi:hypothetical protein